MADALSRPVSPSSAPILESNLSLISPSPVKASSAPKPSSFSPQPAPSSFSPEVYPADDRVPEVSVVTDPVMNSVPLAPALPPIVPGVSYIQMSSLQQSCTKIQQLRQSSALKIVSVPVSNSQELLCDVSTGIHRPLVPEAMRKNFLMQSTRFLILENAPHEDLFPGVLYGSSCLRM